MNSLMTDFAKILHSRIDQDYRNDGPLLLFTMCNHIHRNHLHIWMTHISLLVVLVELIDDHFLPRGMVTIKLTAETLTQITKFLSNRIRVTQIIDVSEMGDSIDLVLVLLKIPGPDYQALLMDVQ